MLNSYLSDTALLLNDPTNTFYTTSFLTTMINRSRRWLALQTLSVRVMSVTLATVVNQETYPITLANSEVANVSGVSYPFGIIGISVQQGNYFVALGRKDFPSFQADERILDGTLQNYPVLFSTYNRGTTQVAYLFPVPAAAYAMWWDLACIPINLAQDTDPEAIPLPWTEIVPFKAAQLACMTQKRWADAGAFGEQIETMFGEVTQSEMPFMRPDWYSKGR